MNKNDGIVMFKDTFEYIVNGELTPEESVLLMKLIYDFKWLDICPEDSDISSKSVRLIWKTLKHTINRSKQNQRAYNKKTDKDIHIADVTPNREFEYTEQGEQECLANREEDTVQFIAMGLNPYYNFPPDVKPSEKFKIIKDWLCHCDRDKVKAYANKMPYKDYLKTPFWDAIRTRKMIEAGYKCQLCGNNKNLNIHHRDYSIRGEEYNYMNDLVCLCGNCHSKFHNKETA